jgi:methylated-DNA-[protein]-cysteine S-methyltransferase
VFGSKASKESGDAITKNFTKELSEYFDGKRREFSVKFEPRGTKFQKKVWNAMQKIEQGKTLRYAV